MSNGKIRGFSHVKHFRVRFKTNRSLCATHRTCVCVLVFASFSCAPQKDIFIFINVANKRHLACWLKYLHWLEKSSVQASKTERSLKRNTGKRNAWLCVLSDRSSLMTWFSVYCTVVANSQQTHIRLVFFISTCYSIFCSSFVIGLSQIFRLQICWLLFWFVFFFIISFSFS